MTAASPHAAVPTPTPRRTHVLLVRHGESLWNAEGRWQGQADPALSSLGEAQAAEAATRVHGVDAVWTSDLARAHRTAEIIAEGLGSEVRVDPRFRERHAGPWQGHTRDEIDAEWPGYLDSGRRPPGWEDDDALLARVTEALADVAAAHPGDSVLVVVHGGIVSALERHLGDAKRRLLPNLGGRWLVAGDDGEAWALGDRVLLLEDVAVTRPQQI